MNYVRDFVNLPENWDSYGAKPIEPNVIEASLALEDLLKGKPWPSPGADGSISFEWNNGDDHLSIAIKPFLSGLVFDFYAHINGRDYEKEDITDDA